MRRLAALEPIKSAPTFAPASALGPARDVDSILIVLKPINRHLFAIIFLSYLITGACVS